MHLILSVRVYPRETGPFKVTSDQSPLTPIFTYQVCQLQRILFCKVSGAWSLQYNFYPFPLPKKNRGQSLSGCPLPNLRVVDWIRKVATKDMCLSRICRWTLDKPSVSREPRPQRAKFERKFWVGKIHHLEDTNSYKRFRYWGFSSWIRV